MKLKEVRIKNFISYGNNVTTVKFIPESLDLICGENGSGKSSILMAVVYALYGRVTGKNLPELVNWYNGNMLVELELECKGKQLLIRRGYKPTIFELYIDGNKYNDLPEKATLQDIVMEYIEIPFEIFTNLALINISKYKNFFTISNKERKERISTIFNLNEITAMWDINNKKLSKLKKQFVLKQNEINYINNEIEQKNLQIKELENDIINNELEVKNKEDLVKNIEKKLKELKKELEINKKKLNENAIKAQNELNLLLEKEKTLVIEIHKTKNDLDSFDDTELVNLKSDLLLKKEQLEKIENSELENKKNDLELSIKELENKIIELNRKIENELELYKKYNDKKQEGEKKLYELVNIINNNRKELEDIKNKIEMFERGVCPICKSDLKTDEHRKDKDSFIERENEITNKLIVLEKKDKDFNQIIKQIDIKINDIQKHLNDKKTQQEANKSDLSIKKADVEKIKLQIENNKEQEKNIKDDINKKENRIKEIESYLIEKKLTTEDTENKKNDLKNKEIELLKIKEDIEKIRNIKKEDNINEIENEIENKSKEKQDIELELKELKIGQKTQLELLNKQIKEKEKELNVLNKEEEGLTENIRIIELVANILSENGFRAVIFDNLIPVLNKHLVYFLNLLEANEFQLVFDAKLDFVLKVNGEPVDIRVVSSGELKKIELALLLSLTTILKLQYGNLNVLMLDEVLATLSVGNVQKVIELLNILKTKLHLNIFLMHHVTLDEANFDRVLNIKKTRLFSEIIETKAG